MPTRRGILLGAIGLGGLGMLGVRVSAQPAAPIIKIAAKKFDFTPGEIRLKKGVPVIFELTTVDVVMGFNIPDFKIRTDIIPGKATQLPFTPDRAGKFVFMCDVFCGSGHEDMAGTLIVE
jgi:cytochrome c oxidase subunit II